MGRWGWKEGRWASGAVRASALPLSKVRAKGVCGDVRSAFGFHRILLAAAGAEAGSTGRRLLQPSRQEGVGAGPGAAVGLEAVGSILERLQRSAQHREMSERCLGLVEAPGRWEDGEVGKAGSGQMWTWGAAQGKQLRRGVGAEAHGGHDAGTPLGMHEWGGVSVDGREDSGSRGAQQAKTDGC